MSQKPLADRMRPRTLDEYAGQGHLVGKGKILKMLIEGDRIPSMIFWGPPGCGKTTLGHIIAQTTNARFVKLSAISSGVKDIRSTAKEAKEFSEKEDKKTILFIDEVHRFNKAQQDAFLPYVEDGTIVLIGATTENPSFEVNSALLSRAKVFVLNALEVEDIKRVLKNALTDKKRGVDNKVKISDDVVYFLAEMANGDARVALNALEVSVSLVQESDNSEITEDVIKEALQRTHLVYDRAGDEHYNIISALHKSMRGGDPDAALYWLGRMMEGGEDPLYIARRIVRFASEDIGIANSHALTQAVAAYQACQFIGPPECNVNLAQAVVYMALSKKSNKLYEAYTEVQRDIKNLPNEPVPLHLRNAPTKMMKNLGFGKEYKYTPNFENQEDAEQDYLPEKLKNKKYISKFLGK